MFGIFREKMNWTEVQEKTITSNLRSKSGKSNSGVKRRRHRLRPGSEPTDVRGEILRSVSRPRVRPLSPQRRSAGGSWTRNCRRCKRTRSQTMTNDKKTEVKVEQFRQTTHPSQFWAGKDLGWFKKWLNEVLFRFDTQKESCLLKLLCY